MVIGMHGDSEYVLGTAAVSAGPDHFDKTVRIRMARVYTRVLFIKTKRRSL
jgi:hypothetical protein